MAITTGSIISASADDNSNLNPREFLVKFSVSEEQARIVEDLYDSIGRSYSSIHGFYKSLFLSGLITKSIEYLKDNIETAKSFHSNEYSDDI